MELKKSKKADLSRQSGLFLNIGLIVSLVLVLLAFEWKSYSDGALVEIAAINDNFEEMTEIPPTEQPPPPPPKIQQPEIIEVPDEEEIEEDIKVDLDIDITDETIIEDAIFEEPVEEETTDEVFRFVEHQPEFPGGMSAFYTYISKNLKYPSNARRMGVEGKVFLNFVIDKMGNITNVTLVRGVGAGCDEEAIRVLQKAPKWSPGRQRGVPVKVSMTLPITFKLN